MYRLRAASNHVAPVQCSIKAPARGFFAGSQSKAMFCGTRTMREEAPASDQAPAKQPRDRSTRSRNTQSKLKDFLFIDREDARKLGEPVEVRTLASIIVSKYAAPAGGFIQMIQLNEPKTRNALSRTMLQELSAEVEAIHAAPVSDGLRALIVGSSATGYFSAGANLKERAEMTPEEVKDLLALLRGTFNRLASLPIPSVAAVSGYAMGGGFELALCTTCRIVTPEAKLVLPETGLGIIPGAGATHRLPALVPRNIALESMLLGRPIVGQYARDIGLASYLATADYMQLMALAWAIKVAEMAPLAVRAVLQTQNDPRGGQEAENDAYDTILHTEDRTEALQAFKEKRKPVFQGR